MVPQEVGYQRKIMQPSVFFPTSGKRTYRRVLLGSIPSDFFPQRTSPLMYLRDSISSQRILVDSVAAVSVFPHSSLSSCAPIKLMSANGSTIRCWEERLLPLKFGTRHFSWSFRLAEVDRPILGADFLAANNLLVDVSRHRLLDAAAFQPFPGFSAIADDTETNEYHTILKAFPEVTGNQTTRVQHDTQHHIITLGPPVFAKPLRLDTSKLEAAKAEFVAMEKKNIIRRSSSAWASPLHMVPKPDGTWRPCRDYRRLNTVTTTDRYPVPNIQDLTARLAGCTLFSKLDLRKGYYQVPVAPEDIQKTAVAKTFGLFEFLRIPFGLRNAGQTFQRFIDKICAGLDFIFIYLDDVLISSPYRVSHLQHVRLILQRFKECGLIVNTDKCVFGLSKITFHGHKVTSVGVFPLQKHTQAILDYPRPLDRLQMQRFLGLVNFYRRFIPKAVMILRPLTHSLVGQSPLFAIDGRNELRFLTSKKGSRICIPIGTSLTLSLPCASGRCLRHSRRRRSAAVRRRFLGPTRFL